MLAQPARRISVDEAGRNAWKSGDKIIDEAIAPLPNLILAVVIFALFLIASMRRDAGACEPFDRG